MHLLQLLGYSKTHYYLVNFFQKFFKGKIGVVWVLPFQLFFKGLINFVNYSLRNWVLPRNWFLKILIGLDSEKLPILSSHFKNLLILRPKV